MSISYISLGIVSEPDFNEHSHSIQYPINFSHFSLYHHPLLLLINIIVCCIILLSLLTTVSGGKNHVAHYGVAGRRSIVPWKNLPSSALLFSRKNDKLSKGAHYSSTTTATSLLFDTTSSSSIITSLPRGGGAAALINPFPSGYNPFGYSLTDLGLTFLEFDGSLDSDVGRFLSTLKGGKRKTGSVMKEQWLEIVRVSKKAQSMRIYRKLDVFIEFCLKAGFID